MWNISCNVALLMFHNIYFVGVYLVEWERHGPTGFYGEDSDIDRHKPSGIHQYVNLLPDYHCDICDINLPPACTWMKINKWGITGSVLLLNIKHLTSGICHFKRCEVAGTSMPNNLYDNFIVEHNSGAVGSCDVYVGVASHTSYLGFLSEIIHRWRELG